MLCGGLHSSLVSTDLTVTFTALRTGSSAHNTTKEYGGGVLIQNVSEQAVVQQHGHLLEIKPRGCVPKQRAEVHRQVGKHAQGLIVSVVPFGFKTEELYTKRMDKSMFCLDGCLE